MLGWLALIAAGMVAAADRDSPVRAEEFARVLRDTVDSVQAVEAGPARDDDVGYHADAEQDASVERVVATFLAADAEGTFEELRWLPKELDPLRGSLVRAVGAAADPRGLPWLVEQTDETSLANDALVQVARLARAASEEQRAAARPRVRPILESANPQQRRLARFAVAALRDEAAVPVLVAQLDRLDELELGQAYASLEQLTGRRLAADSGAWERWLQEELDWSAAYAASTLEGLHSREPARVVAAIHALSERGYQRDRWAAAIGEVLEEGRSPTIRMQACLALQRLRSGAAEAVLTRALDRDEDEEVREAAGRALAAVRAR